MTIMIENVSVEELIEWMQEPVEVDEDEYQKWRIEQLRPKPQRAKRRNTWVSGADFKDYWTCVRILYWKSHDPAIKRSTANKSYLKAILKHELIQERLEERGWTAEDDPQMILYPWEIKGLGHVDCVSPKRQYFLEMKHNRPSPGDELQSGYYQHIQPTKPTIVLLYGGYGNPHRAMIIPDLSRMMETYIPRVVGTVIYDVLPPLHPKFPKCKSYCDYAERCGRAKRVRINPPTSNEWKEYFEAIGANDGR